METESNRDHQSPRGWVATQNPEAAPVAPGAPAGAEGEAARTIDAATFPHSTGAPDIVFRLSGDGTCLDFRVSRGLNLPVAASELVGKKVFDLLPTEVAQDAVRLVKRTLQTGEAQTFEYQLPVNDGMRLYEMRLIPTDENEVVALVHEVLIPSRLEEHMLHSQRMEIVGHLAGGVAHDFNNLLTAILGYCQLGMRAPSPAEGLSTSLQHIQKAAERGAGLCRQLLAFSSRQTVEPRVVSLNDLVLNMEPMLRRLIGEDIEVITSPRPDQGLVTVAPDQFEQVLVNLVVNASDAMPNGGRLAIETTNVSVEKSSPTSHGKVPPGEYVMLAVSDTGIGITADARSHIFEPFFTTKDPGSGTGLGLFTCKAIVAQSHGFIAVHSEPGGGSTFEVYLPRVDGPRPSTVAARRTKDRLLPRGRETVLLVEDERVVRDVAAKVLRQQGYTVLEAADGPEAIRLARGDVGQGVDLLFTDMVMPFMSGSDLADQLKESQPGIKVLYTSGYTGETISRTRSNDRGTAFIDKPFTPAELAHKVRSVLEG